MSGVSRSERFTTITFPHEEFHLFRRALGAVTNLDDLRDMIGAENANALFDLEEEIHIDLAPRGAR